MKIRVFDEEFLIGESTGIYFEGREIITGDEVIEQVIGVGRKTRKGF